MLKYIETLIVQLSDEILTKSEVTLLIKREDLNHPFVSGNKWWKLKYNLEEAKKLGHDLVLTFGGAFSNHIYATAAATNELGLKSIGIIRGEETLPLNSTLSFAKSSGMDLVHVSRENYRKKTEPEFIDGLKTRFGNFYLIPEGGTNQFAVQGCAEFAREKLSRIDFDYLCVPVGTGGTMAGIICGLAGKGTVIGFSVLKDGEFLKSEINELVKKFSGKTLSNWRVETNYHFGGYAKRTKELDDFILRMSQNHDLPLEFVYSAKMVAAVFDLISKNYFPRGSRILMLHTGGLRN